MKKFLYAVKAQNNVGWSESDLRKNQEGVSLAGVATSGSVF